MSGLLQFLGDSPGNASDGRLYLDGSQATHITG
jgi:hypothetical protein